MAGKIAVVTGASRGVGKGIALGLGEAGATVYVTGRTVDPLSSVEALPGTVGETAAEVTKLGGRGVPVQCDHANDDEVERFFNQVITEQGRIDVLVNNVWGGYENMIDNGGFAFARPFWLQPLSRWDSMFQAGVRAHYVSSVYAAKTMVAQKSGLIVNISSWAGQKYILNTAYSVSKATTDRMTVCLAHELAAHNVAVVSLYPGLVRTENVMRSAAYLDLSNSESPQFIGRAVAALAADPNIMNKSGKVLIAAELGLEYGFTDVDGKQPGPLTIDDV